LEILPRSNRVKLKHLSVPAQAGFEYHSKVVYDIEDGEYREGFKR
jgi:hypothetical protein